MRTNIDIDSKLKPMVDFLKERFVTDNLAYIVRLAIAQLYQKNLPQNIDTSISTSVYVPKLPGFTVDVAKSQMMRFGLTADEYESVCRKTIDNFAASGKPMNNPEAAIYGACKRYANEKHQQQTDTTKDTPAAGNGRPSYLDIQDSLPM